MAKYLPPIFTRLYIIILVALCASTFFSFHLAEGYLAKDELNDFVRDTRYVYHDFTKKWQQQSLTPDDYFKRFPAHHYHFDIKWLNEWDHSLPCNNCDYLSTVNNIPVYQLDDDTLLSVYSIAGSSGALLISDRPPLVLGDSVEVTPWYKDPEKLVPFTVFAVALLVIGGILFFLINQLQKQIDKLIQIHQKFGKGNLQIRADEKIMQPINELAANFNLMAESIAETVNESHVISQAVPHEMRTPLSRIQLATGLLRKGCDRKQQLKLLDNIDSYIDDLDELTTQVVNLSRLKSEPLSAKQTHTQAIKLAGFVSSRIDLLNHSDKIEVQLKVEEPSYIECDPVHLRLLFDNLLNNALQHAKSRVLISVKNRGAYHIISVENDGPNIPEDSHQQIFIPFYRLDKSRNYKTGGFGLGLAIAKASALKMGGTLTVKNRYLGGAKFTFATKKQQT